MLRTGRRVLAGVVVLAAWGAGAQESDGHGAEEEVAEQQPSAQGSPASRAEDAQQPPPADATSSPEASTVVTATRLPRPQRDLPATVVVLPRGELVRSPALTTDSLLRALPSAATFRRSTSLVADPSSQGLNLRGVGPSGVSRSLVLLDGVPVNDAFGGWVLWRALPRRGLERVEVVPGGGSALYGSAAHWATHGVEGHFTARNPWMPYHELLTPAAARLVGALPLEDSEVRANG
jgi:iron complex outermembrane recepter protein